MYLALGICAGQGLAACGQHEAGSVKTEAATQAVVYDHDGRLEVFEHHSSVLAAVGKSAVAVKVRTDRIESRAGRIEIVADETLGESKNLCEDQRFRDQPEPGTCSGGPHRPTPYAHGWPLHG